MWFKNSPVKELITQISKQSLGTLINAYTTDETTIYPISSKNDKDFHNLMSVYLDAVFYPNVLNDKRIFEQEGGRYELDSSSSNLKYNGVVYNEMKGDYASADWILRRSIQQSLFPDTSYNFESGGLPDKIPTLTYDELIKTYNENYNPSNCYFYLYGKMDINKTLNFIGETYLNKFDKKDSRPDYEIEKPFTKKAYSEVEYPVPKGTATDSKSYLTLNYVVGKNTDKDIVEAFAFLQTLLGGIPSSPLTKALKDNGFGENVSVQFDFTNIQPTLSITAANVSENQKDKFEQVINDTLKNIVQNGFSDDLINSVLKVYDLSNRMIKSDSSIEYNMLIMRSWIHDGDPSMYLNIASDLANIKNKLKSNYLQSMIQKYLIDNTHSSLVVLKPVSGLEDQNESNLQTRLANYRSSLTKDQLNQLISDSQDLLKWQQTPSSKDELNTLPALSIKDIDSSVPEYKTEEKSENGINVLKHSIYNNGVDYTKLYFNTDKIPQDKLGYIYLLVNLLDNLDTNLY